MSMTTSPATSRELLELASRVEALGGADRVMDFEIASAVRKPRSSDQWTGDTTVKQAKRYTASLDAAMTLTTGLDKRIGGGPGLLNEAWSRLSKRFDLHMCFWPDDQDYGQWLARYLTAASLRARSTQEPRDAK